MTRATPDEHHHRDQASTDEWPVPSLLRCPGDEHEEQPETEPGEQCIDDAGAADDRPEPVPIPGPNPSFGGEDGATGGPTGGASTSDEISSGTTGASSSATDDPRGVGDGGERERWAGRRRRRCASAPRAPTVASGAHDRRAEHLVIASDRTESAEAEAAAGSRRTSAGAASSRRERHVAPAHRFAAEPAEVHALGAASGVGSVSSPRHRLPTATPSRSRPARA